MEVETWLPVIGFEGLYDVSTLGRVRSLPGGHRHSKILAPRLPKTPGAYIAVSLHRGGERTRRTVHVLVAAAFLPPRPSPAHEVRHLDGNRANNRATNLCWGTRKDNSDDRARHGTTAAGERHGMYGRGVRGGDNGQARLAVAQVRLIRELASTVSQRSLAARFGVTQGVIWRIVHRKAWAHV